jgi:hypothetical protein
MCLGDVPIDEVSPDEDKQMAEDALWGESSISCHMVLLTLLTSNPGDTPEFRNMILVHCYLLIGGD